VGPTPNGLQPASCANRGDHAVAQVRTRSSHRYPSAEFSFLGNVSVVGGTAGHVFLSSGFSITQVTAVPEPSAFARTLIGLAALGAGVRRRKVSRGIATSHC
jgi:hypothetical protein